MFIITMSHMNGMVPGDVFKKNVDNTRNRTMLTVVDDALVNHFCNSGGQLPESLNELMALGVKENLDDNFGYTKTGENTYNLWIKGTKEFSANSGRELYCGAYDFSRDEKGKVVDMGTGASMWAIIDYRYSGDHIVGINSIDCYAQYDDVGEDISDYYGGDFTGSIVDGRGWISLSSIEGNLEKILNGATDINTFARACGMDDIFDSTLPEIVVEDILESWGIYIWH